MRPEDRVARELGEEQRYLVTRPQLMASGASEDLIQRRVMSDTWTKVQPGVYQIDSRSRSWHDNLMAAALAAGQEAVASHRAALILWNLDGIRSAPIEITVRHDQGPTPERTICHRTRRPIDAVVLKGIPVTTIERTLLDCCSVLGDLVMTKAVESALRLRLTTTDQLFRFLKVKGGRGVKGTRRLRRILNARVSDVTTGSPSESEALFHLRRSDLPEPVLQERFIALDGTPILPDFYWPHPKKAVEIDGVDAHDSADKLDHDLQRQNKLLDLGIELRRFSARLVHRDPNRFVREVRAFLEP